MLRESTGLSRGVSTATTKILRKRCAASPPSDRHRQSRRRCEPRAKQSVHLIGQSVGVASPCPIIIISSRIKGRRSRRMSELSWTNRRRCGHGDVETRSAASARKLVSALWQHGKGGDNAFEEEDEEGQAGCHAAAKRRSSSDHRRTASVEVLSKLSRRKIKAFKDDGDQRSWYNGHAHGHWFSDVVSNGGTVGGRTPARQGDRNRTVEMQDLHNSLTASNELVRVLANVLGPTGALTPTAASLLAALRSELDAARQLVKQQHRRGGGAEDDYERRLRRQLAEEVRAWKHRHREKAAAAARLLASELDGERRLRRRAERVGKKLAEALADAEAALRAATRELELERASRERLEKVCDELARGVDGGGGVGTEAKEEEELCRREAATAALEELEREREMLQVADELREERVRMKLAEARLQFEEKNAAVERLRQELEAFLGAGNERPSRHELVVEDHQLQLVLASEFGVDGIDRVVVTEKSGQEENAAEGDADDDSDGGDIELNMDGGNSWSYTSTSRSRETTTAKNAASSVHGSLSDRATECGAGDRRDAVELQDWAAAADGCSDDGDDGTTTKDMDEDVERYEAIKNLREQMLAGHGAFPFLCTGEAHDAGSDRHRHGFTSHFEDGGGLW